MLSFAIFQDGVTCGGCKALVKTDNFKRCKDYCHWAQASKMFSLWWKLRSEHDYLVVRRELRS